MNHLAFRPSIFALTLSLTAFGAACSDDPSEGGTDDESTGESLSGTTSPTTTDGSSEDESGGDGDSTGGDGDGDGDSGPEPECDALNPLPLPYVEVPGARRSEDYVFDATGALMSIGDNSLFMTAYGEPAQFLYPGVATGFTAGTSMLPNGDIVFNDVNSGSVRRITPGGETAVVVAGLAYPNGIAVDDQGWVYVAENNGGQVVRFDPDDPQIEVVAQTPGPNGLAFSADYRKLYIGSFDHGGLKEYDFDTEELIVRNSDLGAIDGVLADVCGNVYLTQFGSGDVYRIDPDDNVDLVVNLPSGWIPNLNFGSGVGGWDDHKIYVSDLTEDRVFELDPGTWGINVPHIP